MKVFVQSPGKLASVITNLVTNTYLNFVRLRSFFKISKKIEKRKKIVKKLKKIYMDSDKLINLFQITKG